jgi:hypothetical protein
MMTTTSLVLEVTAQEAPGQEVPARGDSAPAGSDSVPLNEPS